MSISTVQRKKIGRRYEFTICSTSIAMYENLIFSIVKIGWYRYTHYAWNS